MEIDMDASAEEVWESRIPREQLWPVLASLLLVMLLASLDQTIVSTALPKVIGDLHGFDRYSWVATSYLLASTVTVPIYGKLSDLYGRKRILLFGVILFLLGSALSGASQSMNQLIVSRGLQGLGAGALFPIVIAVFGDLFSPRERGKWQGVTGGVFGFAAIIGPTTGGFITDHFSWRWVFYVNLPVGLVALAALVFIMPSLRFNHGEIDIDYAGASMLVVALVPLLLAFTWAGSTYAWGSIQVVGLLIWSICALAVFVMVELRSKQPIVDPRLMRNSIYSISLVITFLLGASLFGGLFYIPLFVQGVQATSATTSGTITTPLMVTAIASSIIGGQILSRTGRYKIQAMGGLLIMVAASLLFVRLGTVSGTGDVLLAMLVMGAGMGVGMSLYTVIVQNAVPQSQIGQVTSGLTFFRSLGGTIGLAVMGSLMTARFQHNLAADLPASLRHSLSPTALRGMGNPQLLISPDEQRAIRHAFDHFGPNGLALYNELHGAIRVALADALHDVFLVTLGVVVIATVAGVFLREVPLRSAQPGSAAGATGEAELAAQVPRQSAS